MSARELITEHLDLWTGAVTKKSSSGRGSNGKVKLTGVKRLRELILELAVRGRLVHQDQNEEPAALLAEKIATEKAALMQAGAIKKSPKLPEISPDEIPFDIPNGWHWIRLGELVKKIGSGATPRGGKNAYVQSGIPFLRSQNIWNDGLNLQDVAYIPPETHERMANTHVFPNDILLNITGASLGRCTVVPTELEMANVSQHVTIIRTIDPLNRSYLHYLILSPYVQSLVWGRQVGMAREGLSKKVLEQFEIPLPPLEEQHRIVQKVDELMALCDRLEQQTSDQLEAHETLVDTLLGTLTQSENATELADNWARLAAHFDTLFTTEQSIDKLKQTILQLAVMGRLVEPDAGDEPATVLLDQISKQKAKVTCGGRARTFPKVTDEEKPFPLPSGWLFKRLGDLAHVFAGNSFKSQDFNNLSGIRVIKITNVGVGELVETQDFLPPEFANEYSKYVVLAGDLILALTRPYISTGLKVAVCPDTYNQSLLNQRVAAIRPYLDQSFLYKYMQSEYVLGLYKARFGGSGLQPNLKMNDVTNLIIPVPPLAEQHRIAQKVDELMALCDQLKERLNQASETRNQLAEAVVEGALN
ncbi:restriction endonuclease subunit S [Marinobacter nauticus]|uniref:Type I restriction modification DNA specificity domain-containing protein n=1 Tax=Marinobacter nauticus TaxID=2743 RepID=A0A1M2UVD8_MARNT|nr:restriction endonuclease subunit S [Marinobacter nauticus]OJS99305.1 hypothetical protein BEE62_03890 [Marinobacter nauticus]